MGLKTASTAELAAELARREQEEKKELKQKVKTHENRKKEFLTQTVAAFETQHLALKELKELVIRETNAIWNEMYEVNGKTPKEQKQISLTMGDYKVTAQRRAKMVFTDEAIVHIDAIREIMKNKFETKNKGMYSFLDVILMKNGKGDYDPVLLARAKKKAIELGYKDLIEELEKLQNCQRVDGTALYCRAYKKNERGAWNDIVIQFSAL